MIDSVKKPARLEFRSVHPDLLPDSTPANLSPVGYEGSTRRSKIANQVRLMCAVTVKLIPEATGEIADAYASQPRLVAFKLI